VLLIQAQVDSYRLTLSVNDGDRSRLLVESENAVDRRKLDRCPDGAVEAGIQVDAPDAARAWNAEEKRVGPGA
jgi:hypothetical protein